MPKWLRALIAGYGAKKLGGGCLSTIVIFVVIYYALGQCNRPVQHGKIIPAHSSPIRDIPVSAATAAVGLLPAGQPADR